MAIDIKLENIFELIELIKKRPELYLGDKNISSMLNYINGYNFACLVNDFGNNSNVYPMFWYFHEWTKEKYNWYESTAGWKNIILQENDNDETKSLKVFFELVEEFKQLYPLSIEYVELTKENLEFHRSELCKTKSYNPITEQFDLPIYENADKVMLVEHSHNFGFSLFVIYDRKLIGNNWTKRLKNSEEAKLYFERLFGKAKDWNSMNGNLTKKVNDIVKYSC